MVKKKEFYKWVKIAGLATFVPFILISGPLAGYFIADFFHLNTRITFIFAFVGIAASLYETARIIKLMLKTEAG